ncbi:RNA-binding protein [Patescibacteria group bacterium]|nr:RNA-binding protein [Patescibacteria group bacterium]
MPVKLFVGGIPYRATEDELREFFSPAGEVVSVYLPLERETQRPRGFAFVEMADQAMADKAITMFEGADMGGRKIAVSLARPMEDRNPRAQAPAGM